MKELDNETFVIQPNVSLPDKIADVLREMILSGKWKPGERVVETRIAKQLKVGQPTVREALSRLEEAGIVRRYPNSGCVVTQLTAHEVNQMFSIRIELEGFAAALASESTSRRRKRLLNDALDCLQKAASTGNVETYYKVDFAFHKTIWGLAENQFLDKFLTQLVIRLFNFAIIELTHHKHLDLVADAASHAQIVKAILSSDANQARQTVKVVLQDFWSKSLALVAEKPQQGPR